MKSGDRVGEPEDMVLRDLLAQVNQLARMARLPTLQKGVRDDLSQQLTQLATKTRRHIIEKRATRGSDMKRAANFISKQRAWQQRSFVGYEPVSNAEFLRRVGSGR